MTSLADIQAAKNELDRFLSLCDQLEHPPEGDLEQAQDQAELLRTQLDAPVRIAITGRMGVGKSSLVNFLVGSDIIPVGDDLLELPPIMMRHSEQEKTTAGWWDQAGKVFDGINLEGALKERPDLVLFEINCEVLQDIWLVDIPALDDFLKAKQARFALSRLADMMIWCGDASDPDIEGEEAIMHDLPIQLRRNSMLVLTHADQLERGQDQAAQTRLSPENLKQFRGGAKISTPQAWRALIGEAEDAETLWGESGAEDVIDLVMKAVGGYKEERFSKVKRAMGVHVTPALRSLEGEHPAAQLPPQQEAPQEPAKQENLAMQIWLPYVQALADKIRGGGFEDDAAFIDEAQNVVSDFLDELARGGNLSGKSGWIIEEFEKANDLMVLLQFETAEDAALDAAKVMLQLSDTLATAS